MSVKKKTEEKWIKEIPLTPCSSTIPSLFNQPGIKKNQALNFYR